MRGAGRLNKTLSLGLCLILGLSSSLSLAAPSEAGKIVLVKGDVFILGAKDKSVVADPSGKRGRSTQKGSVFFEGETIQTKDGARVKLLFTEGGNEIVLGSSTSLVIERAGTAKPGTELSLKQGTVRSSVNKKYSGEAGDIFEVKTPNSVAGVRGTIFNVAYDSKKNSTQVFTERGSVSVASITKGSKPVLVNAGMFSEVKKFGTPTPAATAPADIVESVSPEASEEGGAEGSSTDAPAASSDTAAAGGSETAAAAPETSAAPAATETPETTTASNSESSAAPAPAAAPAPTETKKEDGPAVALAPQPADSTTKTDARAPASEGAPVAAAPKTMTSGGSSSAAVTAKKPMDIINNASSAAQKTSDTARAIQKISGNISNIELKIQ